jgi:hypothetical protein
MASRARFTKDLASLAERKLAEPPADGWSSARIRR